MSDPSAKRALKGRCACGAVEYEVADEFLYAANCHCSACRAMTGSAFSAPTCEALAAFAPDYLVPTHCTGRRAIHAIAARFPEQFIQNSVGTRLEFAV